MNKLLATASVLALLAAPAFAQTSTGAGAGGVANPPASSTTTNRSMDARGDRAASSKGIDKRDRDFVRDAAKASLAEVEEGKMAQSHAQNPEVAQFAKKMVDDHGQANEKLKSIAQAKGIEVPSDVDKSDKKANQKLEKSKNFDRDYTAAQVKDHKKAVKLFESEAKSGKDPELKQFAQATLPTLQEHLRMSQDLEKKVKSTRTETSQMNRDRSSAAGSSTAPATGAPAGTSRTVR
jgi:putative membrane protein